MREFELVRRIRASASGSSQGLVLGIGDDAAVLQAGPGEQVVATTDTLNEGVHFRVGSTPSDLGHKALAVNLSDLAAMGACPRWCLLNLSLPEPDPRWLEEFLAGFYGLGRGCSVALVGGDITRGPLSVTVTALGVVEAGSYLARSGGRAGDRVIVSGTLGDAALAFNSAGQAAAGPAAALARPTPRLALGQALVGLASACIDLSDGLLADLGHVCQASGLGARLDLARLPASAAVAALPDEERWPLQIAGGDDYELCFTIDPEQASRLGDLSERLDLSLTDVGCLEPGREVRCLRADGSEYRPPRRGFEHFATSR